MEPREPRILDLVGGGRKSERGRRFPPAPAGWTASVEEPMESQGRWAREGGA
ncbi:MAG: hypothetical protein AVDCRST_MAG03-3288 [uncultured Rubrobacteraceae bacterium]|uniref:Uncharacterized protein n=1 Tax=uncultured Rubrobacteraceae bacterium TaxID=349277 RepID=A0A6J4Q4C4_9ACTN|nr:MAG: hypothetical protein AVDCRST_MAG03-3288 [uncultured Rubrobacteraceae bacterium]